MTQEIEMIEMCGEVAGKVEHEKIVRGETNATEGQRAVPGAVTTRRLDAYTDAPYISLLVEATAPACHCSCISSHSPTSASARPLLIAS